MFHKNKNQEMTEIGRCDLPPFVAKPGECPDLKRESCAEIRNDCNTDADCATNDKCCYDGCGKTCATPVMPHEVNITTTTLRPGPPMVQPPEISPATEPEVEAEEGNFVSLRCIVTGFPAPTITWIRGTVLFNNTAGKYRILPQGVLQIIGLVRSDSGVYVCTADNGIGPTIKKEFHLTVKEGVARPASVMGDEDSSVLASLGGAATLHCLAIGFPRPAITWWRGSRIIPLNAEGYEQRRDNSLFVGKVTLSDLGYYTCQAYNGLGRAASWSVALKAYGPPGLVQDPNDISYNQFLVEPPPGFYRPQPLPEVQQPGPQSPPTTPTTTTVSTTQRPTVRTFVVPVKASIVLDETVYKVGADVSIPCDVEESNRLMVLGARIEDSGMYRCHARNDYGEDESAVAIKVEGTYIDPKCTDNQFFANCQLIVQARYCMHKYYAKFCCKSCTEAGQLPSQGPHLYENRRRRRSPVLLSPPPLVIERLSLPKS
ncbi:hypothetical protein AAG570_003265 [Ranatra chinensis]|uniref:Papilin n=1 Tax=Ranatra chinensis TaxID=642074 RepID=A0ABD0Y6D2_9HEMI